MSVRLAACLVPLIIFDACGARASAEPIVAIDTLDSAHVDQCVRLRDQRKLMVCAIGVAPNWKISVSTDKLVSGFLDPNDPPPPAVVKLLQEVVDQCGLGVTFLQRGSDFGASLLVGHPDLSATQIDCIRGKERQGLRLEKEEY